MNKKTRRGKNEKRNTFSLTLLPEGPPLLTILERLNCKPIRIYKMVMSIMGNININTTEIVNVFAALLESNTVQKRCVPLSYIPNSIAFCK